VRRVLAIGSVLIAASVLAVFATGAAAPPPDTYRVRAIFENAFSVIPGEDVKIAGVKVGKVDHLDVTPDQKAAVVLRIDRPGFKDFRRDAECTIRPQSLIGENFVECTPTQPRPDGTRPPPPLRRIPRGAGRGQYLLPVTQTSRPVGLDLIANVMRLPERQRLSIIITELGTALAGRGPQLRQAIRNADPALKETDKVLAILAGQNQVLENLARDSDTIMAPLARDRTHVADFVDKSSVVASAAASRDTQLEQNIERLPAFLRQLRPTMTRLGSLSDEMTPVLTDLDRAAPSLNRFVLQLGPFSQAADPAITRLGQASVVGRTALVNARPVVQDLGRFASAARPLSTNLQALLTSVRDTGGIERAMDYLFFQVAAINGFDSIGHYLRAGLLVNACTQYAITGSPSCTANFQQQATATGAAASAAAASATGVKGYQDTRRSPSLRRLDAYLRGLDPNEAVPGTTATSTTATAASAPAASSAPAATAAPSASPVATTAGAQPVSAGASDQNAAAPLLDYLMGG
jgi:phospholipid/cholesterol/gamma-HCH transport system substrate-binding protein